MEFSKIIGYPEQCPEMTLAIKKLAESLKAFPQTDDIILLEVLDGDEIRYEVIDGWCRIAAARNAGMEALQAALFDSLDAMLFRTPLRALLKGRTSEHYRPTQERLL